MRESRNHLAYWAFLLHRVSGLALAVFLPLHFYAFGTVLEGEAKLDGMLAWSEHPLVKVAEWGLIFLLAAHLTGGLRLLALEFLPWRNWQKTLATLAVGASLVCALAFALAR
jgi:fumarate reductase subunit D